MIPQIQNGLVVGGVDAAADFYGTEEDKAGDEKESWEIPPQFCNGDPNNDPSAAIRKVALSSWRSIRTPNDDLRLPHVVANSSQPQAAASSSTTDNLWFFYKTGPANFGTSFAAPQVAGYAAYAYRAAALRNPGDRLATLQATRAMVIASARHNVKTYYFTQWPATDPSDDWVNSLEWERTRLITGHQNERNGDYDQRKHRDGAGMIDGHALGVLLNGAGTWSPWVGNGHFDVPSGGGSLPGPTTKEIPGKPAPDPVGTIGRFRLALTWHPYAGESMSYTGGAMHYPGYDLDMCLFKKAQKAGETDEVVACAQSWDNTYEFMDVDILSDGTPYYVKVSIVSVSPEARGTRVKWALSHYYDAYHPPYPAP